MEPLVSSGFRSLDFASLFLDVFRKQAYQDYHSRLQKLSDCPQEEEAKPDILAASGLLVPALCVPAQPGHCYPTMKEFEEEKGIHHSRVYVHPEAHLAPATMRITS